MMVIAITTLAFMPADALAQTYIFTLTVEDILTMTDAEDLDDLTFYCQARWCEGEQECFWDEADFVETTPGKYSATYVNPDWDLDDFAFWRFRLQSSVIEPSDPVSIDPSPNYDYLETPEIWIEDYR